GRPGRLRVKLFRTCPKQIRACAARARGRAEQQLVAVVGEDIAADLLAAHPVRKGRDFYMMRNDARLYVNGKGPGISDIAGPGGAYLLFGVYPALTGSEIRSVGVHQLGGHVSRPIVHDLALGFLAKGIGYRAVRSPNLVRDEAPCAEERLSILITHRHRRS